MSYPIRKSEHSSIPKEKVSKKHIKKQKNASPEFIVAYGEFLSHRNYSIPTISAHLTRAKQFKKYYEESKGLGIKSLDDFKDLKCTDIIKYEDYLINRIVQKEIKDGTAYSCIKNIRLFLQFLNYKKVIDFTYKIPKKFIVKPARLNSYIPQELLLALITCAGFDNSKPKYRLLALISLLIGTGCRPVELSNLKMSDINLTEKKITLYSVKSSKYTLMLDDFLIKVLKKYLSHRKLIQTDSNHLFITLAGNQISSAYISNIIVTLNKKAFGSVHVNARAIRHTYITNAIENNNEFKEISASVGHKHWESTLYYLHRSKKRLLSNTINFNPVMDILKEDNNHADYTNP